jgi:hypothetical protein
MKLMMTKTAELLNSYFKCAFNKRNEAKKWRQLGSNEDVVEIALANMKIREFLTWQSQEAHITLSCSGCLLMHTHLFLENERMLSRLRYMEAINSWKDWNLVPGRWVSIKCSIWYPYKMLRMENRQSVSMSNKTACVNITIFPSKIQIST